MSKINLQQLSSLLARMDSKTTKRGYNESVIGAQTTLASLGRFARSLSAEDAAALWHNIVSRAGKRKR